MMSYVRRKNSEGLSKHTTHVSSLAILVPTIAGR
jgi:hypothetical protein